MLQKWGSIAKIGYIDNIPAGMIQFRPLPEENVVRIDCIYVHNKPHWRKGMGKNLLFSLIEDMKKPQKWFGNQPAKALIVWTFPGHSEGQLPAKDFFVIYGFKQVAEIPSLLFYPLKECFIYQPVKKELPQYTPQPEDKGKVLIFCGPNKCPAAYPHFLKRMERYIREIDEKIPINYIDISKEPDMAKRRNVDYGDCIVNRKLIGAFVLDKQGFQNEVKNALSG
ncbi:MAG: GNAT family N-acetyltransferase [candidate division WOR-3 bacterium]|nr:GNAT family N-acetyltransferase [candidate division WOR-3 bacterium]